MRGALILIALLTITTAMAQPFNETTLTKIISDKLKIGTGLGMASLIAGIAAISLYYMTKKKPTKAIIINTILLIIFLATYTLYYNDTLSIETKGTTICENNECYWTANIQANLTTKICGITTNDTLKFNSTLPVDNTTQEITNYYPLTLESYFNTINETFNQSCINNKCEGDACNNTPGKMSMTVNGKNNTEYEKYVWKNGDEILINFS